jgi:(2Fe-2S) ferredoxin
MTVREFTQARALRCAQECFAVGRMTPPVTARTDAIAYREWAVDTVADIIERHLCEALLEQLTRLNEAIP